MIDLPPKHRATVERILQAYVPGAEVRAFGSRVTGNAKPYSDLDLAVPGPDAVDWDTLRLMREAFEESDLPFRVEVIDWHRTAESFRKVIEEQYEVLQKTAGYTL